MPRRVIGQVVKIDLHNGYHVYARNLKNRDVAVFDTITSKKLSLEQINMKVPLFVVGVIDEGFDQWEKIGTVHRTHDDFIHPEQFRQRNDNLSIMIAVNSDGVERQITFEEAQTLEHTVGWNDYQVEDRIRDHYAGKTNWMVEFYRPKPPDAPHFGPTSPYTPRPGSIKQISLGDGTYVYGRELRNLFLAIYDSRTTEIMPPDSIIKRPVLFTVSVSKSAHLGWSNVGFEPLTNEENRLPERYRRLGSTGLVISDGNFVRRPATEQEIVGLEPVVTWDNYHIVNRTRAHYAGNPWIF